MDFFLNNALCLVLFILTFVFLSRQVRKSSPKTSRDESAEGMGGVCRYLTLNRDAKEENFAPGFEYSTEGKAWSIFKDGKKPALDSVSLPQWVKNINESGRLQVNIQEATGHNFQGIICSCDSNKLGIGDKREILVWTERGSQYADVKNISLSLPIEIDEEIQKLSSLFLKHNNPVLVIQHQRDLNIEDARKMCLASGRVLQIVEFKDIEIDHSTFNTDDALDIGTASDTDTSSDTEIASYTDSTSELDKGGDSNSVDTESTLDNDSHANCYVNGCKGTHNPDVHVLFVQPLDSTDFWCIYQHIEAGYKLILSSSMLDDLLSTLIPDNWLTYQNSTVGRFCCRVDHIQTKMLK